MAIGKLENDSGVSNIFPEIYWIQYSKTVPDKNFVKFKLHNETRFEIINYMTNLTQFCNFLKYFCTFCSTIRTCLCVSILSIWINLFFWSGSIKHEFIYSCGHLKTKTYTIVSESSYFCNWKFWYNPK